MSYEIFSAIRSIIFIGLYAVSIGLLIPKSIKLWKLWKETGKPAHLSGAIGSGVTAFFFLSADYLTLMMAVGNFHV